ncbi:MAG: transporter substrate-binding protein [Clostridia bacterium]|jgi:branched-chain amino acid transport system substrate-binding protein|nr:transporter substrate-binding protein [Clostridia bacterium]
MKKKAFVLLCVLLVFSLALSGCGQKSTSTGAANDTIKIGWMGSLSGDQAVWGQCEFDTVKMLVEEANAKGGILGKKLEVIGYDTKGDPQEAVNVAKRLTGEDKVVAILGPNASGNAIPIAPVLEAAKVPDIATVATNPKVTVLDGKVKPYNFRVCFIDPYQGAVAAGYAAEVLKAKNAAILYDVGDDYSQGLTQFFEDYFVKSGGTIVAKEGFKSGDVDFRPQLSKIKATNPDVIFMPYFFKEVALSANQARELDINATLLGGDGWPSEQLISMAKDAVEGSYFVNHLDFDDPEVQDFKARYKAKYSKDVELNGYLVHDAFLLLSDSIQRAGEVNSEKIAAAIETANIKGITGKIMIGKDTHNPEGKDAAIIKIVDGKYVFQQKFAAGK